MGVISCKKDDDSDVSPVNSDPYLVEIDTFFMVGVFVNNPFPCNNIVALKNYNLGFKYRINSYPVNFDPKNEIQRYTGIFRVFPDSSNECTNHASDPPFTYNYINVDLLYFKVL
ncbi:MAG: hypothetical protein RH860_11045 [Cytophagales bacterium]